MGYLAKQKWERREKLLLHALLFLVPFLTLAGTMAAGIDERFDFIGEFKVQGALLSVLLMIFAVCKRKIWTALLFLFFALMNWGLIASHYYFSEQTPDLPEDAPAFTVLYQDLKNAEKMETQIKDVLRENEADIVFLTNVPVEIYRNLKDIIYPYVLQNQSYDTTGKMMLILAKEASVARGRIAEDAGVWVSRVFDGRKLTLTLTSLGDVWNGEYNKAFQKVENLAQFVQTRDEPVLLLGDLKATDWSRLMSPLKIKGNLEVKEPLTLSYPYGIPSLMRRPAASIYAHPGVFVVGIKNLPSLSSETAGFFATVKMAPVEKAVVFYELPPVIPE